MTFQTTDCHLLKFLKRRGFQAIDNKFEITPLHKLALFLNPKFKSLNAFKEDEKVMIKKLASDYISSLVPSINVCSDSIGEDDHSYAPPSKVRIVSNIDDEFFEWQDDTEHKESNSEVENYVKAVFEDEFTNSCFVQDRLDLLKFWSSTTLKTKYPKLSRVALGILSIPASSSSSERSFSLAGNIISKKRTLLSAATVDSLIVMNSEYK